MGERHDIVCLLKLLASFECSDGVIQTVNNKLMKAVNFENLCGLS